MAGLGGRKWVRLCEWCRRHSSPNPQQRLGWLGILLSTSHQSQFHHHMPPPMEKAQRFPEAGRPGVLRVYSVHQTQLATWGCCSPSSKSHHRSPHQTMRRRQPVVGALVACGVWATSSLGSPSGLLQSPASSVSSLGDPGYMYTLYSAESGGYWMASTSYCFSRVLPLSRWNAPSSAGRC
ncbi:hypothetical protein B0J11DRAFT_106973 [Dendryphion nanum]|uniref:Uncharacterized protein n=1 Tax=Dendryphion nanum TaxID=256645 RepID=A0A9P9DCV2_9PLEO|nr:hypothetical protein B0J11DRAFT_106973 [Dendryphion nanum]